MLTGAVSSPNGTDEVPTINATFPSIDPDLRRQPARRRACANAQLNVGCRPYKSYTSYPHGRDAQHAAERSLQAVHQPVRRHEHAGRHERADRAAQERARLRRRRADRRSRRTSGRMTRRRSWSTCDSIQSLEDQLKPSTGTARDLHGADDHADRPQLQQRSRTTRTTCSSCRTSSRRRSICGKSRAVTMDLIDNGGGNSLTFPWLNIPQPRLPRHRPPGLGQLRAEGGDRPVVLHGVRGRGGQQAGGGHRGQRHRPRQHRHPREQRHERGRRPLRRPDPVRDHRERRRLLQDRAGW